MVLNGNEDDLKIMNQRMELRQQKHKKKREKNKVKVDLSAAASTSVKVIPCLFFFTTNISICFTE